MVELELLPFANYNELRNLGIHYQQQLMSQIETNITCLLLKEHNVIY